MKCSTCKKETLLPFNCPYCHQPYCTAHRLPENHNCPKAPQKENLVTYIYGAEKEKKEVKAAIKKTEDKLRNKLRRKIGV